uniref:Candidate secreted effector n=1 Tax=Meloidogyne incognita TaxID=6306 RepID=A0A914L362_MELIC
MHNTISDDLHLRRFRLTRRFFRFLRRVSSLIRGFCRTTTFHVSSFAIALHITFKCSDISIALTTAMLNVFARVEA